MMKKRYKPNYTRISNKLLALIFIGLGVAVMAVDGDATVLVFNSMIGVPLFFCKANIMGV